jgi:hypothetical protein
MKPTPIEGRPGMVEYRQEPGTPLTEQEKAELDALVKRPENEIDLSDIRSGPMRRGSVRCGDGSTGR